MTTSGQFEVNSCQFTWKLDNFSKLCSDVGESITTPIFSMKNVNGFLWQLSLYPYGKSEPDRGFLSLFLGNISQSECAVSVKLILSDVKGVILSESSTTHCNFKPMDNYGSPRLIKRDSILQRKGGLKDDILNCTGIIDAKMYHAEQADIDKKILDNYESLFYNENFSDLTIIVKRNHLKVHKNILSARSPVFKAMLSHNMKENNTNTIKITDVSYNIMKEVLLFIYSGKLNDLDKDAKALLPVAEKYEIRELKELCTISIWKNIKVEDACEILCTANLYNCDELKTKVIKFIVANIKEINNTAKFKSLIRSNPELFEEIMTTIVAEKC